MCSVLIITGLCVPVGVAWMGKTANCSQCSEDTHVFVQIWSRPDCGLFDANILFSEFQIRLSRFLTACARQRSDLRVSCGEKTSLKIEIFGRIQCRLSLKIADVQCFMLPSLTWNNNPVKTNLIIVP